MAKEAADNHVLEGRERMEESDVLERTANALLGNFVRWGAGDVASVEVDLPTRWGVDAGDNVETGCLSSPVGTDKTEQVAFFEFERYRVDGNESTELDGRLVEFEEAQAATSVSGPFLPINF